MKPLEVWKDFTSSLKLFKSREGRQPPSARPGRHSGDWGFGKRSEAAAAGVPRDSDLKV